MLTRPATMMPTTAAGGQEALHYITLLEAARRIAARELSPIALAQSVLDRIAQVDPALHAYATVMHDRAIADAQAAEAELARGRSRGPLHGVPVAVKDLCYTNGIRTMAGTAVLKAFVPAFDATVVTRLHDAGAVLLGKLNLTEGAMVGYHPDSDVPRNPWNRDRWPGASSSGSGVAAAAGLCFAAIGTDTGGSIRFPSSACGVVGLKPTYGRVSRHGVLGLAESLDHVGPMARTVADVAVIFDAIAGHDPRDPTSLVEPVESAAAALAGGVGGLRIGVDARYAFTGTDREQAAAIDAALRRLESLGARIVDVKMPGLDGMVEAWFAICASEAAAAHAPHYPGRADQYGPYFRGVLESGTQLAPAQLEDARRCRAAVSAQFNAVLESVDAMACPAGGDPAWSVTDALQRGSIPDIHAVWLAVAPRAAEFTMPMDFAGTPAICLPCGFTADGLPLSLQLAGRRLAEPLLCRIAHAYEQATDWHRRHPNLEAI